VPRHQEIVARILGESHVEILTKSIGLLEITMAIWVFSNLYPKLNARVQIYTIILMNIIELIYASDLLLWGRLNIVFAILFSFLIYKNKLGNETRL